MKSSREETIRHVEFLIAQGELHEASRIWKGAVREGGLPVLIDGNLINNGGFEKKEGLGGAFDWNMVKAAGAEISLDDTIAFQGKSSLRIIFDGRENVDFYHVYQFVPLEPKREYVLKAQVKTRDLTTKSGIKLEVLGVGHTLQTASEALIGDNGWKEITLTFRTAPGSEGALIRVRREKTDRFDRRISGTVWIDNVQLREKNRVVYTGEPVQAKVPEP